MRKKNKKKLQASSSQKLRRHPVRSHYIVEGSISQECRITIQDFPFAFIKKNSHSELIDVGSKSEGRFDLGNGSSDSEWRVSSGKNRSLKVPEFSFQRHDNDHP